jgi:hypothetical protein
MPKPTSTAPKNFLDESTHRVSHPAKVISDLDETELALLMRLPRFAFAITDAKGQPGGKTLDALDT